MELRDFFVKYGYFYQNIYSHSVKNGIQRYKLYKETKILKSFIENLDQSSKFLMNDKIKIDILKERRNHNNLPLIKLRKKLVIIPNKINTEFIVDILRTIDHNQNIIGESTDIINNIYTRLETIDYSKINKDGYNGIYYSRNLVKLNTEIITTTNFVTKIDIGEFPDIIGDVSTTDLKKIKYEIEDYITWLGSDTLILWNYDF